MQLHFAGSVFGRATLTAEVQRSNPTSIKAYLDIVISPPNENDAISFCVSSCAARVYQWTREKETLNLHLLARAPCLDVADVRLWNPAPLLACGAVATQKPTKRGKRAMHQKAYFSPTFSVRCDSAP